MVTRIHCAHEHGVAFGASFVLHVGMVLFVWLLASREIAKPLMEMQAITVQLVPLAQMQPEQEKSREEPKEEPKLEKKSVVPVSHHRPVLPRPESKPVVSAAHATSEPSQQGVEAKPDNRSAVITYQIMPKIPDELRREAFSTTAMARFHVAADGSAAVELLTPSQNPRLNHLLLDALKTWRFTPASEGGKPIASTFDIRVRFAVE